VSSVQGRSFGRERNRGYDGEVEKVRIRSKIVRTKYFYNKRPDFYRNENAG
jgi:hypothetical protein